MSDPKTLIEQAKAELLKTTNTGVWYAAHPNATGHWKNAFAYLQQAEDAVATPPPPPSSGLAVRHFWLGNDGSDAFDYSLAPKYDDFVVHAPDTWASQGLKYKAANPNGRALMYQNFGNAGDGIATALSIATARANGWLAHHNGAEIPNPWGGSTLVMDPGKPGVAGAYVTALKAKTGYAQWDGVFADDVNEWNNLWSAGKSIDGYSSPDDFWTRGMRPLISYVATNLDTKPLIPNVGDANGYPLLANAVDVASGICDEYFLVWGSGASVPPVGIENAYALIRKCIAQGKTFYGVVHRNDAQGARYAFCAAAIMAGDAPQCLRLAVQTAYGSQPPLWDPVYETPLGAPTGVVQHVSGSTAWSRSFGSKTVSIDTAAQTGTIA